MEVWISWTQHRSCIVVYNVSGPPGSYHHSPARPATPMSADTPSSQGRGPGPQVSRMETEGGWLGCSSWAGVENIAVSFYFTMPHTIGGSHTQPRQRSWVVVLEIRFAKVHRPWYMNWGSMLPGRRSPSVCCDESGDNCCTLSNQCATGVQPHPTPVSNQSDSGRGRLLIYIYKSFIPATSFNRGQILELLCV